MNFKLIVTLVAREDTQLALNYYENIRPGLGDDFLGELENRYSAIATNPFAFGFTDSRRILRDCLLERFPYVIIYKMERSVVIILSVHNCYKKPLIL